MNQSGDTTDQISFVGMETLVGGNAVDHFDIAVSFGAIWGGAGSDEFEIDAAGVAGAIYGEANGQADTADDALVGFGTGAQAWVLTGAQAGTLNGLGGVQFNQVGTLTGRSAADRLTGRDQANRWTIDGANTVNLDGSTADQVRFSGMENLFGGADIDSFDLAVDFGTVSGGAGSDEFNIQAAGLSGTIYGEANGVADSARDDLNGLAAGSHAWLLTGAQAGTLNTTIVFNQVGELNGRATDDTLTGRNQANTWIIDAVGNSVANTADASDAVSFVAMETLNGQADEDIFNFNAGFDGVVNGGAGNDSFTINEAVAAALNGDAGDDNFSYGALGLTSAIIDGGSGSETDGDRIQGRAAASLWTLTGANAGDVQDVSGTATAYVTGFSGIERLEGRATSDELVARNQENEWQLQAADSGYVQRNGSAADRVDFTAVENLTGGADDDDFIVGLNGRLTGLLDGGESDGSDDDFLDVTALQSGVVVELGPNVFSGSLVEGTTTLPNFNVNNIERIEGFDGTPEQQADNWIAIAHSNPITWDITDINEGTVSEDNVSNSTVAFVDFGSYQGGAGDETAPPVPSDPENGVVGNITGEYRQGTGQLALDYVGFSGLFVVNVQDNISSVEGNGNTVLRIPDGSVYNASTNTWTISGENAGTFAADDGVDIFALQFSGVNQIEGGDNGELFAFTWTDAANYGNLRDGSINGGGGDDRLTIDNVAATLSFGMNILAATPTDVSQGYPIPNPDTVLLTQNRAQIIDLANIGDIAATNSPNITLYSADNGDSSWQIGNLAGNSLQLVDTALGLNTSMTFSGVSTVRGGASNDSFILNTLSEVAPLFDGGAGADMVNLAAITGALDISVDTAIGADVHLVAVETLTAGANGHTLFGGSVANAWNLSSVNDGALNYNNGGGALDLNYRNITHLVGGAGSDAFTIDDVVDDDGSASAWATIDGNGGLDTLTVLADAGLSFQVATLASGRVVDSGAEFLDIAGIETLTANGLQDNTLIARADSANNWLVAATNRLETLADGATLTFSGVQNLRGGGLQDQFAFDNAAVDGLVDGGGNAADAVDTLSLQNMDGTVVQLGGNINGNLNVNAVEQLSANGGGYGLIAADNDNIWQIAAVGLNTLSDSGAGVSFSGFENLTGGADNDRFVFATGVDLAAYSTIDGGAEAAGVSDELDLLALDSALTVSLDPGYAGADLYVAGLETLAANDVNNGDTARNQLVAAPGDNSWSIAAQNAGELNSLDFSGFADLLGNGGDDVFTFTGDGAVVGVVDGGDHTLGDQVDMSQLAQVRVRVGDSDAGFLNIEQYRGNDVDSVITGADIESTWTLSSGVNSGSVSDQNGNPLLDFSGFNVLEGGADEDHFVLAGGALDGEIRGGLGNDDLALTATAGVSGDLTFRGGDGVDALTVSGGGGATDTRFTVDAAGNAGLEYSTDGVAGSYRVSYVEVENVDDEAQSRQLIIANRAAAADVFTLENNLFTLQGFAPVAYDNKDSVSIRGEAADVVDIAGQVSVADTFEVLNAQVNVVGAGAAVEAVNLSFNGTGPVAGAADRLATNVENLQLQNVLGPVYLQEESALNIASLNNAAAVIDIIAGDAITSASALTAGAGISLSSLNGDITLAEANNFTGGSIALQSPGTVTLSNTTSTQLGDITAQNFILIAGGDVSDVGVLTVAGTTRLDAGGDSLSLDAAGNNFNALIVERAGNVQVVDSDAISVQGAATGVFDVSAGGTLTATDTISGGDIRLRSGQQALLANDLNAVGSVTVAATGISVNGDIRVSDNLLGDAVVLDADSGALALLSGQIDTRNAAGGAGDVVLRGDVVDQAGGADINGGNIAVTSATRIAQGAAITALDNVVLSAQNGDLTMQVGAVTQGFEVDLNATGDVTTQTIIASILRINGVNVNQLGVTEAANEVAIAASGDYVLAPSGAIAIASGDLTLDANAIALNGDIALNAGVASVNSAAVMVFGGALDAASVDAVSGQDIAMAQDSSVSGANGVNLTAEGNIVLTQVNAAQGGIALVSNSGAIEDNNGDALNINALALQVDAQTGVGSESALLNTQVGNIFVENGGGVVGLSNIGEVTVTGIRNNGDITLRNRGGVVLANSDDTPYQRDVADSRAAYGVINAGYGAADVTLLVSEGDLSSSPDSTLDARNPDLIGDSVVVNAPDGRFGTGGRPLVVYAENVLNLSAAGGIFPIWGFGEPPRNGIQTDADLLDSSITGSVQEFLLDLEGVEEIDPAVFTEVRNYTFEDISILMPRDQRYDDDEEEDEGL